MAVSVAAELSWLLDLLVQTARYAEPALDELDRTLLPGVQALRPSVKQRFASLWNDTLPGCPELLLTAAQGDCVTDAEPRRLLAWLSTLPTGESRPLELLTEPNRYRSLVRGRLSRLDTEVRVRRAYRDVLKDVWDVAAPVWQRRGRAVAARESSEWGQRLRGVPTGARVLKLMPPRHPLSRMTPATAAGLFRRRPRFTVVPVFFCMSGGLLTDLGDKLLIGVPASALEPVRRTRDAAFVADRMRILAEPTRVHILIYLMGAPAGVMEITRALGMTQPTVSEHVRVLVAAGLLRPTRKGGRMVYAASRAQAERWIEDARATLVRWGFTEARLIRVRR